jgi:hypothetical protein
MATVEDVMAPADEWLTRPQMAALLGTSAEAVSRLAAMGKIKVKALPATRPKYQRASGERLLAVSLKEQAL